MVGKAEMRVGSGAEQEALNGEVCGHLKVVASGMLSKALHSVHRGEICRFFPFQLGINVSPPFGSDVAFCSG